MLRDTQHYLPIVRIILHKHKDFIEFGKCDLDKQPLLQQISLSPSLLVYGYGVHAGILPQSAWEQIQFVQIE